MHSDFKLTKLHDSISILNILNLMIESYIRIMDSESKDETSISYAALSSHVLLMACSFRDEWRNLTNLKDHFDRLSQLSKRSKPFRSRIDQWTDLDHVRNTFIAHNFRDASDNYSNRLLKPYTRELNIPNKFPDYILLAGCVFQIVDVLNDVFKLEVIELSIVTPGAPHPKIKMGFTNKEEALDQLQRLIEKRIAIETSR